MDNRFARRSAGAGDFGEGEDMSKIKLDLDTARWIADKAQNDRSVFPVAFNACEKCGAAFLPRLRHNCMNTVEIEFNDEVDVDE